MDALARQALTMQEAQGNAPLLKTPADPERLRLLSLVAGHPDGKACVCDLNDAFDLSQQTISTTSRSCMMWDCSTEP